MVSGTVKRCTILSFLLVLPLEPLGGRPGAASQAHADCAADPPEHQRLNLLEIQTGQVRRGDTVCFGLQANKGELIRLSVASADPYIRTRILEPGRSAPLIVRWGTQPVAFEAPAAGLYVLELSVPALPQVPLEANPSFRVQVHEWVSARTRAARREDLRRDPRTAWIRAHATPIRSVEPEDDDFSDLQFLRGHLRDVRVVLLGEENHGAGSTFKAKTRLIKFLHQELGFNVLAFESGIFPMWEAWRALQSATEPREAFARGAYSVWAGSEQLQALIDYLVQRAGTDRPLELVGVDVQFSGTASSSLPLELRALLQEHSIESPLADEASGPSQVVAGILDGRFARDRDCLPSESDQVATIQSLQAAATEIEQRVPGPDGALWGQILRSAAAGVRLYLGGLLSEAGSFEGRDRQMAENLIWLANVHYPGEKLIVWAANVHVMRNPGLVSEDLMRGLGGFTMGHGVSEVLGREAFAVGFTSYRGRTHMANLPDEIEQEIVSDQHSAFEFEELMDAAGHEFAFVNLRDLPERDTWLSGEFWARPLDLRRSGRAPWSEVFDAIFFIHTQEPSRGAR